MSVSLEQVVKLHRQFGEICNKLQAHEEKINAITARGHSSTVAALEIAMTKLFKVALYVHGSYDSKHDPIRSKELLTASVAAFQAMEQIAEVAFDTLASTHEQVTELKADEVAGFSSTVQHLLEETREQISESGETMENIRQGATRLEGERRQNQRYVDDFESVSKSPLLDVAFGAAEGLAWLGGQTAKIWGDYGYDQCEKPLETLRKARQTITDANIRVATLQRELHEQTAEYGRLNSLKESAEVLNGRIPELIAESGRLISMSEMMLKVLISLKATTARLVVDVQVIEGAASYTASTLDNKANIASSILDVCQSALIDKNVTDEVRMIMEELSKGYEGTQMPKKVQKGLSETAEALEGLLSLVGAA